MKKALLMIFVTVAFPSHAHEAVTGWMYPAYCCGGNDCGDALEAHRNPDGSLTVTTRHGTAVFPKDYKYYDSPDGLIHACFSPVSPDRLYCLFLSSGM